jgi:hypothetical protein
MSDKAQRLVKLITTVRETASVINAGGNNWHAMPLWQAINLIATKLGYENYSDFNEQFIEMCASIKSEIAVLSLRREQVRQDWLACVARIQGVFNAENFPSPTIGVLNNHFSGQNLATLEAISERLEHDGILESSEDDLAKALSAVEDVVAEMHKSGKMDAKILSLLSHYISQMKAVLSQYEYLGDDKFWRLYKETFATFIQVHNKILECDNSSEIVEKIKRVVYFLSSKSIVGVSLLGNAATVVQFFLTNYPK